MNTSKKIFFNIIIIILALSIIEALSFVIYKIGTSKHQKVFVESTISNDFLQYERFQILPQVHPHPYMLYDLHPGFSNSTGIQINSLGYRDYEFSLNKTKTRILALGGSTTYGASVLKISETWPKKFESMLNNDYQVINGGVNSAASPEILTGWLFKYSKLNPDYVLLNIGINDIWPLLLTKNYKADYSYFRKSQSYPNPNIYVKKILDKSWFLKIVWVLIFNNQDNSGNDVGYPYRQAFDDDIKYQIKNNLVEERSKYKNIGFETNILNLTTLIKSMNAKVIFIIDPVAPVDIMNKKIISSKNFWMLGLEKYWLDIKSNNDHLIKDIAKVTGDQVIEVPSSIFTESDFTDWYHLNALGEMKKAKYIKQKFFLNN